MSKADDRRAEQDAAALDDLIAMNQRPVEPAPPYLPDRRSWASTCAGWRGGIHERHKEDRILGIWKCKWCAQTFDEPTPDDLEIIRQRNLSYQRPQRVSSRRW